MTSWYRDYQTTEKKNNDKGSVESQERNPASRRPNHRFDFEIGHLVKSPCKGCAQRDAFPGCDESCKTLDKIHAMLCDSVSCTKHG